MQVLRSMQKLVESVGMMLFSVAKHLMAAVMPLLTHKRHKASHKSLLAFKHKTQPSRMCQTTLSSKLSLL